MAAKRRVRVRGHLLSLSVFLFLGLVLCWVYELYRFLCGRILFLLLFLFCIIFLSAFCLLFALLCCLPFFAALPFLAAIKMSFYMSNGDIWLEDLPGALYCSILAWFLLFLLYEYFLPSMSLTFMFGSTGIHYASI